MEQPGNGKEWGGGRDWTQESGTNLMNILSWWSNQPALDLHGGVHLFTRPAQYYDLMLGVCERQSDWLLNDRVT